MNQTSDRVHSLWATGPTIQGSPVVVALVMNQFVNDSRVMRENRTLSAHGYRVTLLALHQPPLPAREWVGGFEVRRLALRTRRWSKRPAVQLFKYLECMFRMVWAGWRAGPSFVHANDLNTLPIGFLLSRLTGAALIYDSHEYWAGGDWRRFPGWSRRAALWVERTLAKRAAVVTTVSPGIAERLRSSFSGVPVRLVRNVPDLPSASTLPSHGGIRSCLGLPAKTALLLFQGHVIPSRGIETAIEAMAMLPQSTHLAILGAGSSEYVGQLRARAKELGVSTRITFLPPVPSSELIAFSSSADFGLSPLRSQIQSVALSLPNKVFEYLQSGLPIVHSGSEEVRTLLEPYGVGRWFPEGDAAALAAVVDDWLSDPDERARLRLQCRLAAAELNWDNEHQELLRAYHLAGTVGAGDSTRVRGPFSREIPE